MQTEKPWFRQFWPWFLIGLLSSSILGSLTMLAIAITHPQELVVSPAEYAEMRQEFRPDPAAGSTPPASEDDGG